MKPPTVHVRPIEDGRVYHPTYPRLIAAEGEVVPRTADILRALRRGDLVEVAEEPATTSKKTRRKDTEE